MVGVLCVDVGVVWLCYDGFDGVECNVIVYFLLVFDVLLVDCVDYMLMIVV